MKKSALCWAALGVIACVACGASDDKGSSVVSAQAGAAGTGGSAGTFMLPAGASGGGAGGTSGTSGTSGTGGSSGASGASGSGDVATCTREMTGDAACADFDPAKPQAWACPDLSSESLKQQSFNNTCWTYNFGTTENPLCCPAM